MQLFNDALDDTPADAGSLGFLGMDANTKPDQLPPDMLRDGRNLWMDGSGIVQTRPGLRLNAFLDPDAVLVVGDTRVQGAGYYDTPTTEELLAVRNGKLYAVDSSEASAAFNHLVGPTPSATAGVKFAQLVDRMFYSDGTLRWALYNAGWTFGTVSTFSTAAAMPTWSTIIAHNFRLLAVEAKGYKLYASAVASAHNPADWVPTENIRVGTGEGDPIKALISSQGGNLIVLNLGSAWLVDTTDAALANWTVRKITDVAGCVEGKTAVALGQDVFFLSRYGVVSLGALSDNISLNPATTLSAPVQPYIDRINWLAVDTAFATVWQELYLLAVPLDEDTLPTVILPFNVRTRKWMTPWTIASQGVLTGDASGAAVLIDEDDFFLVDETGAVLLDSGVVTPSLEALEFTGVSAAALTRFAGRQETVIGDSVGRLLRIDPSAERDDTNPTSSQPVESWATLKAHNFDLPQNLKQPFTLDVQFERSTATGCQLNLVRDGQLAYPDITLAASETIAAGLSTGNLTSFPVVFPLVFKPNTTYRRSFHLRDKPRFIECGLQVHSPRGRLRLRSARFSAFIDSAELLR